MERIWRREGLKAPQKQRPRRRLWLNDGSCIRLRPERANHVWSYDFVNDRTHDGRLLRILALIDEYTRECLALRVARRLNSQNVIETLSEVMLWPTLKALEGCGGSASIQDLPEQVATDLALPDEILDILHKDGPRSEVDYRGAWARTHLKMVGAVDNTSRGIWTITAIGRRIQTDKKVHELIRLERAKQNKERQSPAASGRPEALPVPPSLSNHQKTCVSSSSHIPP